MMKRIALYMVLAMPAAFAGEPHGPDVSDIPPDSYLQELQRLHEIDSLLELQLRIAGKLVKCRETGYLCAGVEQVAPHSREASADSTTSLSDPLASLPSLQVVGIYQDRIRIRLGDEHTVEVRIGQRFGHWHLVQAQIDTAVFEDDQGRVWHVPVQAP